jgi:hypothetical protein
MRVTFVQGLAEPLLPQNRYGLDDECTETKDNKYCFVAG